MYDIYLSTILLQLRIPLPNNWREVRITPTSETGQKMMTDQITNWPEKERDRERKERKRER